MGFMLSPAVSATELDLSTVVPAVNTSVGAIVGYSARGPLKPTLVTTNKQLVELYGNPVPGNYLHYSALGFLMRSSNLYLRRVINGALYGGALFMIPSHANEGLDAGVADPDGYGFTGVNNALDGDLTDVAVTVVVDDTTGFTATGTLLIEAEQITYTGKTGTSFTGCTRGANGTTAVAHLDTTAVYQYKTYGLIALFPANPGAWNNNTGFKVTNLDAANYEFDVEFYEKDANGVYQLINNWTVSRKQKKDGYGRSMYIEDVFNEDNTYVRAKDNTAYSDDVLPEMGDGDTTTVADDPLSASAVTVTVPSGGTADFASSGTLIIEDEQITYTGKTLTTFTGCTRGVNGTTAAAHDETTAVYSYGPQIAVSAGGDDGSAPSNGDIIDGWTDFEDADTYPVNILMSNGYTDVSVLQKIDTLCGTTRRDCIGILDAPYGTDASGLVTFRRTTLGINSSYSALYASWLKVYDSYNDKNVYIPPSGHIGGVYAWTDYVADPWFAPAGPNRGILSVIDLEKNFTKGERDLLYQAQINVIRRLPVGGTAVWGQKTLQTKPSALDRVNVRRLLITIEKAITVSLEYWLFEPNDTFTRSFITTLVGDYLRDIKGRRGVYDYRVVCDDTNNTAERIDRNELWVDVYVKPVKAAEFIQLRVIITRTGASFDEVIGGVSGI